ncbi:MAG: sodium ion-translocating decarboxylase subunit beta [Oscillospiraceae bacterium]|jgi:oxaloacetate decarboxylase beta subunit|nr:sodium ion-translocating decarboxylase subunit beta [Oscillospiraceae bacterium]
MKNKKRSLVALLVLACLVCMLITVAYGTEAEPNSSFSSEETAAMVSSASPEGKTNSEALSSFLGDTGFARIANSIKTEWKSIVMILVSFLLMYLAIGKGFEPLLLLPIAFGVLLTNLPGIGMYHSEIFEGGHVNWGVFASGEGFGLIDILYLGVKLGIYPCLIFVGVGAATDFGPLIANPKSLLLGAAAQLGIFIAFLGALALNALGVPGLEFTQKMAASIGIIGGADGPTAIYVTSTLAPSLLGPIAIAAYSYMALVPVIQPPIMRGLTTKKERAIRMDNLRTVSKTEKIIFPIAVTAFVALLVPSAAPLVGCLMLGNLLRECGVTDRLAKTAQNELMNIVVIFLGISVGATAKAASFLEPKTLAILALGVIAFAFGTAGGVLFAKFINLFSKKKINPLIGSAGVSAVPMAARVSQKVGRESDSGNFLLMHAMGPNVAGVIGSAVAAGAFIALFG